MEEVVLDEAKQLLLLQAGDKAAFEQIYNHFKSKMYRAALYKVRSDENAMEIVQEIFLDLWYRREQVIIDDLEKYLFSSVKHKVLNFYKKEILRKRYAESIELGYSDECSETEEKIAYNELSESVLSCIGKLPEKTRTIFELNRFQCKSSEEISLELGIPKRTVEYHITQSLKALRISLQDYLIILLFVVLS
jgi:RNA polymerase sigma-70 factor (family 1)